MLFIVFDTTEEKDKFLLLYEKYGKYIYYTINRFTNDTYTMEDISQEIYIKLAQHLTDIDLSDHQRTRNYIITITRNYCINFLRSQKTNEAIDDFEDKIMEPDNILDNIISLEQVHRLAEEVGKLKDIYKTVLELKYYADFSNEEIASFLKIEKKTVEMRLYRAKLVLRERLKDLKYDA